MGYAPASEGGTLKDLVRKGWARKMPPSPDKADPSDWFRRYPQQRSPSQTT